MENNYQLSRIHNYVNGLMSKEERYDLEREALEDPFLQDAIDGYALQNGVDTLPLSILQKRLQDRIQTSKYKKNRQFFTWQRLSIGSVAAVMFLVVCVFLFMKHFVAQKQEVTQVDLSNGFSEILSVEPILMGYEGEGHPMEGWNHLNEYFIAELGQENLTAPIELTFDIVEGRPVNIEVVTSETVALSNAVIEILRKGPEWEGKKAKIKLAPNLR